MKIRTLCTAELTGCLVARICVTGVRSWKRGRSAPLLKLVRRSRQSQLCVTLAQKPSVHLSSILNYIVF